MLASDHQARLGSKFDTLDSPRIETLAGRFHQMDVCNEHILLELELSRDKGTDVPVETIVYSKQLSHL